MIMVSSKLRREVLRAFKGLHRARTSVFEGDQHALQLTRAKINEEFKKNKDIEDEPNIAEMIKFSKDVETELKTTVVQAREVDHLKYEVRFRDETVRMDNTTYKDIPEEILTANRKKGGKKCGNLEKK